MSRSRGISWWRAVKRVGRKVERAGQREWVGQQLQRMAQIDDIDRLAGVELPLQLLRLEARGDQLPQEPCGGDTSAAEEEADNRQQQQRAGESAHPVRAGLGSRLRRSPKSRPTASSALTQSVAPMPSKNRNLP